MPVPQLIGPGRGLLGGPGFSPRSIPGLAAWYDASDMNTLWTNTGRTGPVLYDGDTVATWDDKSGNGNHLVQSTAANRPTFSKAAVIISGEKLNGNFEALGAGPPTFANWAETLVGSSTVTAVTGYTGLYAARLTADSGGGSCNIQQAVIAVGRTYRYGFFARSISGSTTLAMIGGASNIVLTTSWAYYTGTFTATGTSFGVGRFGANQVFEIDGVTLEQVQGVVNDAVDDYFSVPTISATATERACIFIMKPTKGDADNRIYDAGTAGDRTLFWYDTAGAYAFYDTASRAFGSSQTTLQMAAFNCAASNVVLTVNGVQSGSAYTGWTPGTWTGGVGQLPSGANDRFLFCEVIFYKRALTAKELAQLYAYALAKWGLAV